MDFKLLKFAGDVWKDINDAATWCDTQQYGRGLVFVNELKFFLKKIEAEPHTFHFYKKNIRIAVLKVHPYFILYAEQTSDIFILAVIHSKRGSRFIKNKLK